MAVTAAAVVLAGCASTTTTPAPGNTGSSSATSRSPSGTSTPADQPSAAPESNPPGDIPDNQVYVAYRPSGGGWQVKVPEGWARTVAADGAVTFTDKLNAVRLYRSTGTSQPTVASITAAVTRAEGSRPGFALDRVATVTRTAGTSYRAVYQADGQPDPVTGKTVSNDVEQYTFWRGGAQVELRLSGPRGADNVDPWRTVSDSFRWA